jgi:adenylate kinase family enzyme
MTPMNDMQQSRQYKKSMSALMKTLRNQGYKTINVIGPPGSGKTTLSSLIAQNDKWVHKNLDTLLFDDSGTKSTSPSSVIMKVIRSEKHIVLDGLYYSSLKSRIESVDLFVVLDTNMLTCSRNILHRSLRAQKLKSAEKISLSLIRYFFKYFFIYKRGIHRVIPVKKIYHF